MLGPTPDPAARFRIVAELGRGAVGAVYRAVEEESGREVALKVLLERPDPTRLARFAREGEVTAALDHPGIVRVHASGVLGGRPFLAYELVPGGETLAEGLPKLDRSLRLRLLRDAAAAVGHAHARGVVHRDLKPANVLVDRSSGDVPRARVADFGMARLTGDSQDRLTRTGAIVGTPQYMAPEQAAGTRDVGPPADVWALGVMLYEALVDRLPFDGDTLQQLLVRICAADPTPPRTLDPALATDLEAVVLRALEGDPARRYPDAGALAADLDAFLRGEPVSARRSLAARLRRRRGLFLGGAALAGSLALVTGAVLLAPRAPEPLPSVAAAGPRLTVLAPAAGAVVAAGEVALEVRVDAADEDRLVEVRVGPRAQRVRPGRPFTARVDLTAGEQVVVIAALDAGGGEARLEHTMRVVALPAWWVDVGAERRPALPLPDGLEFGAAAGDYVHAADGSVLVWVPPGEFMMGSEQPGEGPSHRVVLTRGVFMGKHEVTWGQFLRFCAAAGRDAPPPPDFPVTDDLPVVNVTAADADAYAAWAGLRLPTEAEWEWAARGPDGRVYPWGDAPPVGPEGAIGYTRSKFKERPAPVGAHPAGASPWGCLDMAGNVWEWVQDAPHAYPGGQRVDPRAPAGPGDQRLVRGGSFRSPAQLSRASTRTHGEPGREVGFRVCRDP
ncbi:MAG: bifunctional serine/threonine-protein kinase/formylglycine-generating enzyme family protein [Planctomycetes bacterium]|nr:bifunctional serine/threonine-protein kinase/formylglycine-generating enzyme family protein [Planctomycetota bacterium]